MQQTQAKRGDLLIATASLADSNFEKAVVLLCNQTADGAYGLILNRPASPSQEVLEKFPFLKDNLYEGGPVERDVLQVLHRYGNSLEGATSILDGVWLGGNFEQIQEAFKNNQLDANQCRFFAGYAGWASEQLQQEFLAGAWMLIPATVDLVFHTPEDKLWSSSIRQWGKQDPMYSHYPEEPRWN